MRGITNAQGVGGPYLAETLAPLIRRISLLENNPPVGSLTQFDGFDWVVVHWDTKSECIYLMLKGLYTETSWSDSGHVPYENSNVKAELLNFEEQMKQRLLFQTEHLDLSDVLMKDTATDLYSFIPTADELRQFSLFTQKAFYIGDSGRRSTAMHCNAIVVNENQRYPWWLSDSSPDFDDGYRVYRCVSHDGSIPLYTMHYSQVSGNRWGVRPFLRMKMR